MDATDATGRGGRKVVKKCRARNKLAVAKEVTLLNSASGGQKGEPIFRLHYV